MNSKNQQENNPAPKWKEHPFQSNSTGEGSNVKLVNVSMKFRTERSLLKELGSLKDPRHEVKQ